ncbi:MAG: hypothetical protein NE330_16835 [Lentisphaeraceae bacterium]|nr:hypothetical protein [Lentisphaeraceae bacterium]
MFALIFVTFMLLSNTNAAVKVTADQAKSEEAFQTLLSKKGLTKKEKLSALEQAIRLNSALAGKFTAMLAKDPTISSADLGSTISAAIAALPDSEKASVFTATTTALKNNGHSKAEVTTTVTTVTTTKEGGQAATVTTRTTSVFSGGSVNVTVVRSEDSGTDS